MTEGRDTATPTSTIDELRTSIDRIDRELLGLLARRNDVVTAIAAYKRERGVGIRDLHREQEVLANRAEQAAELNLSPGVVESIYRLILLASREHQSRLRVEVPPSVEPRDVAVIGGRGGMGACMAQLFSDLGHRVVVADLTTSVTPEAASANADVVVISVPIDATDEVIRAIGPKVKPSGLLMDVTSLKAEPVRTMLASTRASVVGTHPLFGPGVHTLLGQRMVVCAGRGDAWLDWLRQMFKARGLIVAEATPEEHDRAMAIVQVLNHFQTQAMGLTLARLGAPLRESLRFTSPAYLLEAYVTARHFAQAPELYGPIEMRNPATADVTDKFLRASEELRSILLSGDQARFNQVFGEVRAFFGDFTREALEQSGFLIDRLVELTAGRASPK